MARAWRGAILSALVACNSSTPINSGAGLTFALGDEATTAGIDTARAPLLDSCAENQAVLRTETGWRCGGVDESSFSAADRARFAQDIASARELVTRTASRAAAARVRIEALESLLAASRAMFERLRATHALSTAAITCLPAPEPWVAGEIFIERHTVRFLGTEKLELFCGFPRPRAGEGWRVERWDYVDPSNISGTDFLKGQLLNFRVGASDTISSSWSTLEVAGTGTVSFPTQISMLPDPAVGYPYHRLEYFTPDGGPEVGLIGVAVTAFPYAPPELQRAGGTLFVDLGAAKESHNNARRWHDDEVFLSGGPESGIVAENGGISLDRSGLPLEDQDIEAAVLRTERTCDCSLRVTTGAPPGRYGVQLYSFDRATGLATRRDEELTTRVPRLDVTIDQTPPQSARLSAMIIRRLE